MTKRGKRKTGKARSSGRTAPDRPIYTFVPGDAQRSAALRQEHLEAALRQQVEFPVLVERLLSLFRLVYPPHLIAVLAGWGLRTAVSDTVTTRTMIAGLGQHHVEMLQALALTLPSTEWGDEQANPVDIQSAVDTIRELAEAFQGRRYLAFSALTDKAEMALRALQERLRLHTQVVRNWGYYSAVLRISRDLYGPLDARLVQHHGFGATQAIAVVEAVVALVDRQVDERFRLLKSIFRARSVRQLVRLYFERYPGVKGDPQAFLAGIKPGTSIKAVRARLLSHADRWLVVCASVTPEGVADQAGLSFEVTTRLLDRLCLAPGDLDGRGVEQLFMSNPVWTRPGLKSGGGYFFATPQTAASFIHDVLGKMISEAGLDEALSRRRARFLEDEAARVVASALPGATILKGVKWRWENQGFETDVLAVLDRTLVVVEAKSARLTAQGLKGAPKRIARHIRELVVEPSLQSERLEAILGRARDGCAQATSTLDAIGVSPQSVDTVVRVTVTLDDFSVLCSAEGELKAAGLVAEGVDLVPTLNIADFGCVADLLGPARFIHYFAERRRLQKRVNLIGDELDLLGFYLETGFNLNGQPEVVVLALSGMSEAVDRYYMTRDAGLEAIKPTPRRGVLVAPLLDRLEERRPQGWTTLALDILRAASPDEQTRVLHTLEEMRQAMLSSDGGGETQNAMLWTPPHPDDAVLVFYLYRRAFEGDLQATILELANEALNLSGRPRCAFLGRMIEDWSKPWNIIGMAYGEADANGLSKTS